MRKDRQTINFRVALDRVSDMVTVSDCDGRIVYANAATKRLTGYTPEEFRSRHPFESVHPEDLPLCDEAMKKLLATPGLKIDLEHRIRHKSGEWRWVSGTFESLFDDPDVKGILATVRHITFLKAAEEALRSSAKKDAFRLSLNEALRALEDPERTQAEACRKVGEYLGVASAYYVEVSEAEGRARIVQSYMRGDSISPEGSFRVEDYGWIIPYLRSGRTAVVEDAKTSEIIPDGDRDAMELVGIASHISTPVIKAGELVGAFCVTEDAPRAWTENEIAVVSETAERVWSEILRTRAEAALRESEERQRFLLKLTDKIQRLDEPVAVQETASRLLGERLGVKRAAYGELGADGEIMTVSRDWTSPDIASMAGEYRIDDFGEFFTDPLKAGTVSVIEDALTDERLSGSVHKEAWQRIGVRSAIAYPLIRKDRLAAAFFVHDDSPRVWSGLEKTLVGEVGERTWEAVRRSRAQSELKESEERFSKLVDQSPLATVVLTPHGKILRTNPAWNEIWNLPPDFESRGCDVFEDERVAAAGLLPLVRKGIEGEQDISDPVFYDLGDVGDGESSRWLRVFVYPVWNTHGIREVVLMLQDVTESKLRHDERETYERNESALRAETIERERISRDLHDRAAHSMGVVHQSLELYTALAETDPERAAERLALAKEHALKSLDQTRNLAIELRSSASAEVSEGMESAIGRMLESVVPEDVEVRFDYSGEEMLIPHESRTQLYFIIREALANIIRHSGCDRVVVEVETSENEIYGLIADDGDGFDSDEISRDEMNAGIGLRSMRERAEMLDGELAIESSRGNGTRVKVRIPNRRTSRR